MFLVALQVFGTVCPENESKKKKKKKPLTNMHFNTWMVSSGYRGITELNVFQAFR